MEQPDELMRLPASLLKKAMMLAQERGISLNQWIAEAVEEKVSGMIAYEDQSAS